MSASIPRAKETPTTAPFWAALREQRVMLPQCQTCERWYFPFSGCVDHENEPYFTNVQWREASGRGQIFTLNVHVQEFNPLFPTPYVYAIVEMDEGPMYPAQVIPKEGTDAWDVAVGERVEAEFVRVDDDYTYLRFRAVD